MKKSILIILILILFTLGCGTTSTKKTTDVDVRVGFNGLLLEFLKNTPPQKLFEDDVFPVIIKVRNNGAYSLEKDEKAILSLGIEKDYTKKIELLVAGKVQSAGIGNAATFNLEGKSKINTKGEEEVISYNIQAGKVDPQSEFHASTVIATLCYPYQTILDTTVCVDTDISNLRPGKKACKAQDLILNNGQGAPIAIAKIEVNMLPAEVDEKNQPRKIKPQFLIFIENKGQGTAIKKEVVKDFCTKSDTSHENLNRVYVSAKLSNEELDCTPKEKESSNEKQALVKLKDKKELVRCTLEKEKSIQSSLDPYLSPLRIELNYGYTQSISANYLIQKATR